MGPNGEILDGGADLLNASIASYYQDLIYLCAFVQVCAVLTSYAWWAFWLVPLVAAWILYTSIVQPYILHRSAPKVRLANLIPLHNASLLQGIKCNMSHRKS